MIKPKLFEKILVSTDILIQGPEWKQENGEETFHERWKEDGCNVQITSEIIERLY